MYPLRRLGPILRKTIEKLPFHIGFLDRPNNPEGIVDALDFHYSIDGNSGVVKQEVDDRTLAALQSVYSLGLEIGTPLADDEFGAPYLSDFSEFILNRTAPRSRILEIGVGRGHLSRRLLNNERHVIGIEPGNGYSQEWDELGITVVNDFFPSGKLVDFFDAIVSYAVLEHVPDPRAFLVSMASQLKPFGKILLSVPDCSEEIQDSDASMFIHEHLSYFSKSSLERLIASAGLNGEVMKSSFGRCLYAEIYGSFSETRSNPNKTCSLALVPSADDFLLRTEGNIRAKREFITNLLASGSVGVFAPARALPYLSSTEKSYRLFDDDPRVQGKFLVPFPSRVESRIELMNKPVDALVIASRTFGREIMNGLRVDGYRGTMFLLWGLR